MKNDFHAYHQTDLPIKTQILNISVNLARIGNWIDSLPAIKRDYGAQGYTARVALIEKIVVQTESYLSDLKPQMVLTNLQLSIKRLKEDFGLYRKPIAEESRMLLAEKALTWANILQHRVESA